MNAIFIGSGVGCLLLQWWVNSCGIGDGGICLSDVCFTGPFILPA